MSTQEEQTRTLLEILGHGQKQINDGEFRNVDDVFDDLDREDLEKAE
ncbi:hypothetical protein [Paraburkholderia unamae]|uniref:Antitoxin ParD1/3/4 n=1 Tax=Paraburkholderia unamae TaxID=219649 RepID=A0ABX5KK04_9BURK|nr:hypothetical protein [Paraburkholderia unamae]PVX77930.1 hypothetical protein C7402_114160 [Paraburkholderia unamae]